MNPIHGVERYKCRVCDDFDLCGKCKSDNLHPEHEMGVESCAVEMSEEQFRRLGGESINAQDENNRHAFFQKMINQKNLAESALEVALKLKTSMDIKPGGVGQEEVTGHYNDLIQQMRQMEIPVTKELDGRRSGTSDAADATSTLDEKDWAVIFCNCY